MRKDGHVVSVAEDFFFGGAMSGPQTGGKWQDGGKAAKRWDTWCNLDIHAFTAVLVPITGNDFTERMEEDLQLLVSWHGFHSHFYPVESFAGH